MYKEYQIKVEASNSTKTITKSFWCVFWFVCIHFFPFLLGTFLRLVLENGSLENFQQRTFNSFAATELAKLGLD